MVPLRVNVNLKAVTVEDLVARRKVGSRCIAFIMLVCKLLANDLVELLDHGLQSAMTKNLRYVSANVHEKFLM